MTFFLPSPLAALSYCFMKSFLCAFTPATFQIQSGSLRFALC